MSIGPLQALIIIAVILIFFGPSRLPGLGKSVGEAIRGFKKGISGDEIDVTDSAKPANEKLSAQDSTSTQKSTQSEKDKV
ncbi:MAG TPA: twin-arginine translocase TatA/TatE family subunit [Pseudobdellovibrionaceae bacterium]|nr:twin-arginine translocase TatA/TatE family subunit [Pseudobdellovibrionaceae bacterium]